MVLGLLTLAGIYGLLAALFILVAVFQLYLRQLLQIRWRRWLTEDLVRSEEDFRELIEAMLREDQGPRPN